MREETAQGAGGGKKKKEISLGLLGLEEEIKAVKERIEEERVV